MKKLLLILTFISFAIALSSCNTVNGFGKDMKEAGEKIEDASKK